MTLNYIGSKKSLLPFIDYVVCSNIVDKNCRFGDLFAGTGVVGEYFSKKGFIITSNDKENYSYVINYAILKSFYNPKLKDLIESFNKQEGVSGLIHKNYSPYGNRKFFTESNSKKADSIRIKIEELKENNKINDNEYYFLLASLLQSLDKVANTTSVYGAFLKKFKKTSLNPLILTPIHTREAKKDKEEKLEVSKNTVIRSNILEINETLDVAYLDPPYVARQYGANYFPLNYLVEYDKEIKVRGKTGIYDYYKSPFASKSKAKEAFKEMFKVLTKKCSKIFLSYNNQGILTIEEIQNIMKLYGSVCTYEFVYKKYQAVKSRGGKTKEYIHYLDCSKDKSLKIIQIVKDINGNITTEYNI